MTTYDLYWGSLSIANLTADDVPNMWNHFTTDRLMVHDGKSYIYNGPFGFTAGGYKYFVTSDNFPDILEVLDPSTNIPLIMEPMYRIGNIVPYKVYRTKYKYTGSINVRVRYGPTSGATRTVHRTVDVLQYWDGTEWVDAS